MFINIKNSSRSYTALLVVSLLIALPAVLWSILDASVWTWDPANYGLLSLKLNTAFHTGASSLLSELAAESVTAPLLYWTGALTVSLGYIFPRPEAALLLSNIIFALCVITFMWILVQNLARDLTFRIVGALVLLSSPSFRGLTQTYFVEIAQMASISLLMYAGYCLSKSRFSVSIPLLIAASAVAMLAKFSSIFFIVPIVSYSLIAATSRASNVDRNNNTNWWIILFSISASTACIYWYIFNIGPVLEHAEKFSTSQFAEIYGSRSGFITKFWMWCDTLSNALTPFPYLALIFSLIVVAALIKRLRMEMSSFNLGGFVARGSLFSATLALLFPFVIGVYSTQINEESRFIAPLIPVAAVSIAWALSELNSRWLTRAIIAVLCVGYCFTTAQSFGFSSTTRRTPWYFQSVNMNDHSAERLSRAVAASCRQKTAKQLIMVGVGLPDFNANSLTFESAKQAISGRPFCNYTAGNPYETDLEREVAMMEVMKVSAFITLPYAELPKGPQHPFFSVNHLAVPLSDHIGRSPGFTREGQNGEDIELYLAK